MTLKPDAKADGGGRSTERVPQTVPFTGACRVGATTSEARSAWAVWDRQWI